jgi:[ribosomal protein S5]-alanine N-acetyltransferase
MNLLDVQIESERLLLHPISRKYREDIFREFTVDITLYMYPQPAKDISETDKFITDSVEELSAGTTLQLVILKKIGNEFLGCAGLHHLNRKNPELGIWVKRSAHGNGFGREAIDAIKKWADENLDYEYLKYPVAEENNASRKIPESLRGKVFEEKTKTMPSGKIYKMFEYRIYRNIS